MKYAIILLAAIALNSCAKNGTKNNTAATSAANKSYVNNVSMAAAASPSRGNDAADFSWYDSNGKLASLSSLRGKTVLVNFWATWCGPCKAELPDIEAISREYSDKGFVVVGVSEDRGDELLHDVSGFASKHGLTYQIVIDNQNIADAYGNINAIPTSFLINKDGQIVDKWIGERDKAFFESTVNKYLN